MPRPTGPGGKFENHLEERYDEEDAQTVHGGIQGCDGSAAGTENGMQLTVSVVLIGTSMLANPDRVPRWATSAMGGLSSVLVASLLADLRRRPS